jgi:hypothetical protein
MHHIFKHRNLWLCLLLAVAAVDATAQSGLLVEDKKYSSLSLLPTYSGTKYNEVPLKVSLRSYCPVPGDQGSTGACVGWATGYGALTILRAQNEGITDPAAITEMAHSAAFIYNQIRLEENDCVAGAFIEDALALLRASGDCLESTFNFKKQGCLSKPTATATEEALRYRIRDYAAVFELDELPRSKVSKTCKVLATNTPLLVGMGVTQGFWEVKPGSRLWNPSPDEAIIGYHALVVVGYDNVERQFDLMNSFGPGWGNGGFIKIPYDDFERLCRYAYVLLPGTAGELPPLASQESTPGADERTWQHTLSGEFVFRRPAGYLTTAEGDELPWFEEVPVRRNPHTPLYEAEQGTFPTGEVFQLVAREIPRGRYAYVFSQNPDGKVNLHFPKIAAAGKSAGFVLEKTAEIVIPSEQTVLQLSSPGEDYLCILFSEHEIPGFEERFATLKAAKGKLPERVDIAFGDLIANNENVRFSHDKMAFTALTSKEKMVVPVLLKVVAE